MDKLEEHIEPIQASRTDPLAKTAGSQRAMIAFEEKLLSRYLTGF